MATITGLTAARMQEIIDGTIVDADIIGDHLILTKEDGSTIDTGVVKGDPGAPGAPGANASNLGKGAAFPAGATDGDLFVRTDQVGDPLYKYTDGAWAISAGGLSKVTGFPGAPTDGDVVVRTDLNGSPMFAYSTENGWEQTPRMGAVTVPAVKIRRAGADQSAAANSVDTVVAFDTADVNTNGMWAAGAPTRFTVQTPGRYFIEAAMRWSAAPDAWRRLQIRVNGATIVGEDFIAFGTGSNPQSQNVRAVVNLAAGDYVELIAHAQYSGAGAGAAIPMTTTTVFPYMTATWLGGSGQTVDERGVPAAKAYRTAVQAIPNATWTAVAFDASSAELYDTDSIHDPTSSSSRFTIKTPGLYSIAASVDWNANGTGIRFVEIRKNGLALSEMADYSVAGNATAGANRMQVTTQLILAAGDYIELMVHQTSGGALDLAAGSALALALIGSGKTVTPFARAFGAVAQALTAGANTVINFDSERTDNDSIHDTTTNPSRLTCRTAGVYQITAHIGLTAALASGQAVSIYLRKNGTAYIASSQIAQLAYEGTVTSTDEAAVGDYYEVIVIPTSAVTVLAGSAGSTSDRQHDFAMVKIGAPIAGQTGITPVEGWHLVGGGGEPAFAGAWINYGGSAGSDRPSLAFYKDPNGMVKLRGSVKSGAGLIFTLPVGYRPSGMEHWAVANYNGSGWQTGYVSVYSDGHVSLDSGSNFLVALDAISFRAEV